MYIVTYCTSSTSRLSGASLALGVCAPSPQLHMLSTRGRSKPAVCDRCFSLGHSLQVLAKPWCRERICNEITARLATKRPRLAKRAERQHRLRGWLVLVEYGHATYHGTRKGPKGRTLGGFLQTAGDLRALQSVVPGLCLIVYGFSLIGFNVKGRLREVYECSGKPNRARTKSRNPSKPPRVRHVSHRMGP